MPEFSTLYCFRRSGGIVTFNNTLLLFARRDLAQTWRRRKMKPWMQKKVTLDQFDLSELAQPRNATIIMDQQGGELIYSTAVIGTFSSDELNDIARQCGVQRPSAAVRPEIYENMTTRRDSMIEVVNNGQLIVETNFWESEIERAGQIFCSTNAGAVRILLPRAARSILTELRRSKYCILSRGPWPEGHTGDGVEFLWEDDSRNPFTMHFGPGSFDVLPGEPGGGQEWVVSIWDVKGGRPQKCLERLCHWRRVPSLPCLKKWKSKV